MKYDMPTVYARRSYRIYNVISLFFLFYKRTKLIRFRSVGGNRVLMEVYYSYDYLSHDTAD